jgi:hypothetical protein
MPQLTDGEVAVGAQPMWRSAVGMVSAVIHRARISGRLVLPLRIVGILRGDVGDEIDRRA